MSNFQYSSEIFAWPVAKNQLKCLEYFKVVGHAYKMELLPKQSMHGRRRCIGKIGGGVTHIRFMLQQDSVNYHETLGSQDSMEEKRVMDRAVMEGNMAEAEQHWKVTQDCTKNAVGSGQCSSQDNA